MKSRIANRYLLTAVMALMLCAILAVTSLAVGVTVDNTLAGLLAGETYTANSYDLVTGTAGTENIDVDKTTVFTAGLWEITTPDGKEYVFVPGDTTGKINFWDSAAEPPAPADVRSEKAEFDPGKWTGSNDLLLMSEIDHANFTAGSNDGFAFKARRTQLAGGLNEYYFQYTFAKEQIVPAKFFESFSASFVLGNTFTLIEGKTVKTTVVFHLKNIGDTELTSVVADATYTDGVFTVTAPTQFATTDAYIVAMDIRPWGGNAADEELYEGLASSNNFFGIALNKGDNAVNVDLSGFEYVEDVALTNIAFTQPTIEGLIKGTVDLNALITVNPPEAFDKRVMFTADAGVINNGIITLPDADCVVTVTAKAVSNETLTATLTIIVKEPEVPTGLFDAGNGHLGGLEAGKNYEAAPLTISADGTVLTKGAYFAVDATTDLAGLYVVHQGANGTYSEDSEMIYVAGDADKRNALGNYTIPEGQTKERPTTAAGTTFTPGTWKGTSAISVNDWAAWIIGSHGQVTLAKDPDEATAKGYVDKTNAIQYLYAYESEEIIPVDEALSFKFTVQQNNGAMKFKYLRTKFIAYVAGIDGKVTPYEKVLNDIAFEAVYGNTHTQIVDFKELLPEEGYLVGIKIFPATDIKYDEYIEVVSGGHMRFLVNVNPANYLIVKPAKAPEFSYAPNAKNEGIDVTITNYDSNATYEITGGYTVANGKFTVTEPGDYTVKISGEHLIGTAEAVATVTKFTPEDPTFTYSANNATSYAIKIENYSEEYKYEYKTAEATEWVAITGNRFTVELIGSYKLRAGGIAFDGYAEVEIVIEKFNAETPVLSHSAATADTYYVVVDNYSDLYTYKWTDSAKEVWTEFSGDRFEVTAVGKYYVEASGVIFDGIKEAEHEVAQLTIAAPTKRVAPGVYGTKVTITNFVSAAKYEYQLDGASEWTVVPAGAMSFTVTDPGVYTLKVSGAVYSNAPTTTFSFIQLPAEFVNLEIAKENENDEVVFKLRGFAENTTYAYAAVNVTTDFSSLAYTEIPAGSIEFKLPGEGLYAVKITSQVAGYDGFPVVYHASGDGSGRTVLGTIVNKGTYDALDVGDKGNGWYVGKWNGPSSMTHSSYASYYLSSTGDSFLTGALGKELYNAIDSGDPVAIADKKALTIERAAGSYYNYAYAPDDIVPANEFLTFKFTTSRRQGQTNLGLVTAEVIFHVMDSTGTVSQYKWTNDHMMTAETSHEIKVNYEAEVGGVTKVMSDIPGWPSDGWVVGVEIRPWTNAKAENIQITYPSNGVFDNTLAALRVLDPVTVKVEPETPVLNSLDAPAGGKGAISGLNKAFVYEYRYKADANDIYPEWDPEQTISGKSSIELDAGYYEIRVKETIATKASPVATIYIATVAARDSVQNETKKIHLPNDFLELKADYEMDIVSKPWVSTLALNNLKTVAPESTISIIGDNFKYVVVAGDIDTSAMVHYYNFAISFDGASRHDTQFEDMKELAGDEFVKEFFTESLEDIPFKAANLYIYVGTEYDGSELELRSYNDRIGKLRKVDSGSVENGWAMFTKFGETYVIVNAE